MVRLNGSDDVEEGGEGNDAEIARIINRDNIEEHQVNAAIAATAAAAHNNIFDTVATARDSGVVSSPDTMQIAGLEGEDLVRAEVVNDNEMEASFRQKFIRESINEGTLGEGGPALVKGEVVKGEVLDNDGKPKKDQEQTKKNTSELSPMKVGKVLLLTFSFVLVVVVLVVVLLVFSPKNGEEDESTSLDPGEPSLGPALIGIDYVRNLVQDISGSATLYNESSPQYKAMHWLVHEDAALWSPGANYSESWLTTGFNNTKYPFIDAESIKERYIMAVLYYSTDGANWENGLRFLSPYSVCEWPNIKNPQEGDKVIKAGRNGLACDINDRITKILILKNKLNGTLPSELASIQNLEYLSFERDSLTGTIPTEWGNMGKLTNLQLYGMNLTGPIPESFTKLTRLAKISVFSNKFTGTLPEFNFWPKVERLDFGDNNFVGTIPQIPINSKTTMIDLCCNQLTGTLPISLYSQPQLKGIYFENNKLNGTIGKEIEGLSKLEKFYMHTNKLTGTLPTQLLSLFDLSNLIFNKNRLSGPIPTEIGNMRSAVSIDLSDNQFSGSIPSELGRLENSLTKLSVAGNKGIQGIFPSSIGLLGSTGKLKTLSLEDTAIIGGIDEAFCKSDVLFTAVTADCGTSTIANGGGPKVDCSCCKSCCTSGSLENADVSSSETAEIGGETEDDSSVCTLDLKAACRITEVAFKSNNDREVLCSCSEDGTRVSCLDVECESCSLDGHICAKNTDYGYGLDPNSGDIVSFHNTLIFTNHNNTQFEDNTTKILKRGPVNITFSTYPDDQFRCYVSVDGQKCRSCTYTACNSGFIGFEIDCDNVVVEGYGQKGYNFHSCTSNIDVGFLEIFHLHDKGQLVGCPLILEHAETL